MGGRLAGRGFGDPVGNVRDVLLRGPGRAVHDQPTPVGNHRLRGELARVVVCSYSCAEHRVPAPKGLFPERLSPGKCAIFDHPLVSTPDVINEDVDTLSFPGYAFERRGHLCIQPMVAANTRDAVLNGCPLLDRTTSNEDSRAAVSKCTCDAPAKAEACCIPPWPLQPFRPSFAVNTISPSSRRSARWKMQCGKCAYFRISLSDQL